MSALTWQGQGKVSVDNMPDPKLEKPDDNIIKVTTTAICGSDLHLYDGYVPMMKEGDIIGYEPMVIIEKVGSWFFDQTMYSLCDISNPKPKNAIDILTRI